MFKYQILQKTLCSFVGYVVLCGVFSTQVVYGQTYQNQHQQNSYSHTAQPYNTYQQEAYPHNGHQQQAQQKPKFSERVKNFLGIGEQPGQNPQGQNQQGQAHNHNHNHNHGAQYNQNAQHANAQPNTQHSQYGQHGQQHSQQNQHLTAPQHSNANTYHNHNHASNSHGGAAGYNQVPANPGAYTATQPSPAVQRRPQTTTQPTQPAQTRTPGVSRDTAFPVASSPNTSNNAAQNSLGSDSEDANLERLSNMRSSIFENTAKEREMMLERKESKLTMENSFNTSNRTTGSSRVGTSSTRRSASTTIDDDLENIPDEPLAVKSGSSRIGETRNSATSSSSRSSIVARPTGSKAPKIALPVISAPPLPDETWDDAPDLSDDTEERIARTDDSSEHEIAAENETNVKNTLPKLGNRNTTTGKTASQNRRGSTDSKTAQNKTEPRTVEKDLSPTPKTASNPSRRVAAPTELSKPKDPLVASRQTPQRSLQEDVELPKLSDSPEDVAEKQPLPLRLGTGPYSQNAEGQGIVGAPASMEIQSSNSQSSIPNPQSPSISEIPPNNAAKDIYPPDYSHKETILGTGNREQGIVGDPAPMKIQTPNPKPQSPISNIALIEVEMTGPKKRVVGQESLYQFKIVNRGGAVAEQVVLSIEMPTWAEIQSVDAKIGTTSSGEHSENEETHVLNWNIDRLEAGESNAQLLAIHLVPRQRKTLTMSWDYTFKQPIGQTIIDVLEPKLEMSIEGPFEMLWGTSEDFRLRIQNTGNGDAEDLYLAVHTSDMLPNEVETHPTGTLKAGEEKVITILNVSAKQQEKLDIKLQVNGPFGLQAEAAREVKVLRSKLTTFVDAPEMQFVGNQNEYRITVQNTGTATAQNVQVKAWIPPGAKYVSNQGNGRVPPGLQNQLIWNVDAIPVGEEFVCSLVCDMRKEGVCKVDVTATEKSGLSAVASASTQVDSIADLVLRINNPQGPVEVGKIATHTIVVTNRGSRAAENVEVVAAFAEGVSPLETDGGKAKIDNQPIDEHGGMVYFDVIPSIGSQQSVMLKIKAKSSVAGKQKIRVELLCPDSDIHLVHEETTHYYSKQKGNSVKNPPERTAIQRGSGNPRTTSNTMRPSNNATKSASSSTLSENRSLANNKTAPISNLSRRVERQPNRTESPLLAVERRSQTLSSRQPQTQLQPQTQTQRQAAPVPVPITRQLSEKAQQPQLELKLGLEEESMNLPKLPDLPSLDDLEPLDFDSEESIELTLDDDESDEDSQLAPLPIGELNHADIDEM